jgi:hypothetical protein
VTRANFAEHDLCSKRYCKLLQREAGDEMHINILKVNLPCSNMSHGMTAKQGVTDAYPQVFVARDGGNSAIGERMVVVGGGGGENDDGDVNNTHDDNTMLI